MAAHIGPSQTVGPPPAPSADLHAFIRDALDDLPTGPAVLAIPCTLDPVTLLEAAGESEIHLWRDRDGRAFAGAGVAAVLKGRGPGRFHQIAEAGSHARPRIVPFAAGAPAPRWVGGFAFAEGAADQGPWRAFGDGRFVLPRLALVSDGDPSWLLVAADAAWVREMGGADGVAHRLTALARGELGDTAAALDPARPTVEWGERWEPAWEGRVRAALASIRAGAAEKLVLARRSTGRIDDLSVTALLRRLDGAVGTFRFGFRVGASLFVGATPERLVSRHGAAVRTEALAGTAASEPEVGTPLERRPKDLHEHRMVVEAIRESLAPLCRDLDYDATPRPRAAGPVRHLATGFRGVLREDTHVLRIAEALHPTPAVGGWPTDAALRWLAEHEPDSRGWYAAPVGWFNAAGDGELAVALRCGLIHDGMIHLYAGAGIVEGSDPRAEHEETELKMRALPQALGLDR